MKTEHWFRVFAVIYAILAFSNFTKPLEMEAEHGFVFLGERLNGTPNLVVAPVFGAYLAAYAYGLWTRRKFALPLGLVYAIYVPLNMYLFSYRSPDLVEVNSLFGMTYISIAMTMSWGAALLLLLRSRELT
jgi:hypothetical protein